MVDAFESDGDVRVADNVEANRYEVFLDGSLAGFANYRRTPKVVIFLHTEIDPAFEGHGLGSALARAALEGARAAGERVIARCPFIAAYIERHPEYADLVTTPDTPSS
ncbi:MAG TPA: GNAT family N-acetyltransferase [Acidimicrobiales bacterium]|nr:GNAT family N-acetyltransferase [Acidimicrobiales bacterium]